MRIVRDDRGCYLYSVASRKMFIGEGVEAFIRSLPNFEPKFNIPEGATGVIGVVTKSPWEEFVVFRAEKSMEKSKVLVMHDDSAEMAENSWKSYIDRNLLEFRKQGKSFLTTFKIVEENK